MGVFGSRNMIGDLIEGAGWFGKIFIGVNLKVALKGP